MPLAARPKGPVSLPPTRQSGSAVRHYPFWRNAEARGDAAHDAGSLPELLHRGRGTRRLRAATGGSGLNERGAVSVDLARDSNDYRLTSSRRR